MIKASVLSSIVEELVGTSQPRERITRSLVSLRSLVPYVRCAVLDPRLPGGPVLVLPAASEAESLALRPQLERLLRHVSDDDAVDDVDARRSSSASHLALPLHGADRAFGVLFVDPPAEFPYDEESLSQLRVVAASLGSYLTAQQEALERTKLERIAEELKRVDALALERMTEVLESMVGDAFVAVDPHWTVVLVNRNFEELSHAGRQDLLGRPFWDVFAPAAGPTSTYRTECERCMSQRVMVEFIDHHAPLDLWTKVRAFPRVSGGIGVFARDVSLERQAASALKLQAEFATDGRATEKHLLGIVSHDLANPLHAILLGTVTLEEGGVDGRSTKVVKRMRSAAERATRMVKDLLDFTQARLGGGLRITRAPVDLHEVVRNVVDEVQAIRDREFTLRLSGDGHGNLDGGRLGQVAQNLITNAVKYSPPRTIVAVEAGGDDDDVTLSVHNQGSAIPTELLERIFEPMQRANFQADTTNRSVGLGLYIVKSIVDAHGGRLAVTSSTAAGTTFTVRLPRAR
ncbi:MAG: PAS domain-containing sensor histidine kinase [Deltaproteobacteria bacterium]|nr:PAS domain-containing sensor histidine kinase [Deltaproteobacteria bacterium]